MISTGIGVPMVVNYNSYTSKESRAISRCDYDAVPLLASLSVATQKKKPARSTSRLFIVFRV